jgi:hypothetical protein
MAIHGPFHKGGSQRLFERTKDALADIPHALKVEGADYPILRIFASWKGDAKLERTLEQRKLGSGCMDDIGDPDQHPLATLHMENFKVLAEKLASEWFHGCR